LVSFGIQYLRRFAVDDSSTTRQSQNAIGSVRGTGVRANCFWLARAYDALQDVKHLKLQCTR
jgi:hypothetical protein